MKPTALDSRNTFGLFGLDNSRGQAMERLSCDPLFARIPEQDREALVEDALAIGADWCATAAAAHCTRDPLEMARRMQVRVVSDIGAHPAGPFAILSAYHHNPPCIRLYETVIARCRQRLASCTEFPVYTGPMLPGICVAHELFHHIEHDTSRFVNNGYRLPVLDIGFLKIEKSLSALSEIAAHSFARSLLGLPFLPCALDPLLLETGQRDDQRMNHEIGETEISESDCDAP